MSKLRDNIEQVTKRIPWDGLWDLSAHFRLSLSKRFLDEEIRSGGHRDTEEEWVVSALEDKIIQMTADENGISDKDRMDALESMGVQHTIFSKYAGPKIRDQIDQIILANRNKRT